MKIPTRAAFPLLLSAALLAAGCDDEVEEPVPEGVSVEPAAPPAPTGGVTFPGEAGADTARGAAPGVAPGGAPEGAGGGAPP